MIRIKHTSGEELNYRACCAFGVLRAKARSAVPALMEIAGQDISAASRWYALEALVLVGPPGKEAISVLFGWATNADAALRFYAINVLGGVRDAPSTALPVLLNALHDPDPEAPIRDAAPKALQGVGPNAKPASGVGVELLRNQPGGMEWSNAAAALKAIAPQPAAKTGVK